LKPAWQLAIVGQLDRLDVFVPEKPLLLLPSEPLNGRRNHFHVEVPMEISIPYVPGSNQLMMCKAKVAVCSEIRTKHAMQSEHHVEFLNVKPGDT
jgi:hypothetical protein